MRINFLSFRALGTGNLVQNIFKYQPQDHRYVLFERGRLRLFGIDMMELSDLPSSLESAAEPVDKTATYKSDRRKEGKIGKEVVLSRILLKKFHE